AEEAMPSLEPDGDKAHRTKHYTVPRVGFAGFIRAHWRGELTLVQAYWGVTFLLTLLVVALSKAFGDWLGQANLSPVVTGIALISFLGFLCAMTIWQPLGVWRSAGDHINAIGRRGGAPSGRL